MSTIESQDPTLIPIDPINVESPPINSRNIRGVTGLEGSPIVWVAPEPATEAVVEAPKYDVETLDGLRDIKRQCVQILLDELPSISSADKRASIEQEAFDLAVKYAKTMTDSGLPTDPSYFTVQHYRPARPLAEQP
jgi:hypothetical protein